MLPSKIGTSRHKFAEGIHMNSIFNISISIFAYYTAFGVSNVFSIAAPNIDLPFFALIFINFFFRSFAGWLLMDSQTMAVIEFCICSVLAFQSLQIVATFLLAFFAR